MGGQMDTSDDPITMAVIGGAFVASGAMSGGGGSSIDMPTATAESGKTATATPIKQTSEQEKINKRLAASLLTKNWSQSPTLGKKGLLGLGSNF
ncbi:MAG: hypothetical protein PHQ00_00075 [Phycisphaerae bacterium]|nr:hypothetical protein [Phycisphaerae bacterium]